jgi:hypothetical protein
VPSCDLCAACFLPAPLPSDSDHEALKPIKRSRSDQSLATITRYGGSGRNTSSNSGGGSASNAATAAPAAVAAGAHSAGAGASSSAYSYARTQRAPSLPVVLSDVGSSSNSLRSLDAASEPAARAGPVDGQQQRPAAAGVAPLSPMQQPGSLGVLYSMAPVSSAASFRQYAHLMLLPGSSPAGSSSEDLTRTTSYGSVTSSAQQPLHAGRTTAFSPPPLLSPEPLPLAALGAAAGLSARAGVSIQQQKMASFVQPQAPAAAAAGSTPVSQVGMRHVASGASLYSSDSITSVEAGERLAGLRFGLQRHTHGASGSTTQRQRQQQPQVVASPAKAPAGTPASNGANNSSSGQLPPLSPQMQGAPAAAASSFPRAALPRSQSSGAAAVAPAGSSVSPSPAPAGAPPSSLASPVWAGSDTVESLSRTAGGSPAIQLQSMGSMLGEDGAWLSADACTGAMGPLLAAGNPAFLGPEQLAQHDQQQRALLLQLAGPPLPPAQAAAAGLADAQQSSTSGAAAAAAAAAAASQLSPVVSQALPAHCAAVPAALPVPAAMSHRAFGFGQGAAAAPSGVAAAAAAARLGLLGAGSTAAAGAGVFAPAVSAFAAAAQPQQLTASAAGGAGGSSGPVLSAGSGWGSTVVSAPLPKMPNTHGGSSSGRASAAPSDSFHQQLEQWPPALPHRPASHPDGAAWGFARRPASFDCARTSLSGRRRGSLELSMPWRKTVDAAIAKAAAAAEAQADAVGQAMHGSSSTGSGGTSSTGGSSALASSRGSSGDAGVALQLAASEAEAMFGAGAVAQIRGARTSQLDLLAPLVESDAEAAPAVPCGRGPGSIGPGSVSSFDVDGFGPSSSGRLSGDSGRGSGSGSSSSGGGASVAADHDLPGSTNIGAYIGATDGLGLARCSLDSPRALQAVGVAAATAAANTNHAAMQAGSLQQPRGPAAAGSSGAPVATSAQRHVHRAQDSPQVVVITQGRSWDAEEQLQQRQHAAMVVSAPGDSSESSEEDEEDGGWTRVRSPQAAQLACPSSALGPDLPGAHWDGGGASAAAAAHLHREASAASSISSISSRGAAPAAALCGRGPQHHGSLGRRASATASQHLELLVRLNRARQTLDYAKRQAQAFADLERAELSVWEALALLDSGGPDYEAGLLAAAAGSGSSNGGAASGGSGGGGEDASALTPDLSATEHALQVAELCRLAHPDKPWMALAGLLHGLGKLLLHPMWGPQPPWAVMGESFPVGCKFAPQISASEFFSANADRCVRGPALGCGAWRRLASVRDHAAGAGGACCPARNAHTHTHTHAYTHTRMHTHAPNVPAGCAPAAGGAARTPRRWACTRPAAACATCT